ncbi:HTH-type transcriptional repressor ComR [Paraburkholderia hiiakae]|uniref:HTH-type transcriptional repressor ComR n=1 Tax=Paraburkholderia hiiakae TaxID=1081782 RepID=A0ABN7HHL0_9BURK|nr:TetR/AcrR family transcriptional regulator [Paraburkholderia hiiakae]CAD6518726.1 HTH-type transcriptional repressor ComR [Paraburkholderia hiiakae]
MSESPRKRGRPRTLDRDVGLDIAARLFWERGYEGTSIADLTEAMGITPPSLYATFGSKDDLFKQALDRNSERENQNRLGALQGHLSAYDAIAFYLHDAAAGFTDPGKPRGCMVSTAVLQHGDKSEAAAREVAARRDLAIQLIKKRFDRALAEGELATGTDTVALARFYAAVVQGMSAQACDGACSETLRRLADIALSAWPGISTGRRAQASQG